MKRFIDRRAALQLGASFATLGALSRVALAQAKFFRIGTGGTSGTYYPVGGLIGNAISTPELNVSAVSSNGSVANVNGIIGGSMESGFVQADVATWAYTGTGIYEGKAKVDELRAIANLYPETVHVVVKKGVNAKSIADLKGKRISIDEPGSGTIVNAKAILAAFGLADGTYTAEFLKQGPSGEKLKDGGIDAFFVTGGYPTAAISELATTTGIDLLPIDGEPAEKLLADFKFFTADEIPDGTYNDVKGVKTISVGAQWVTSSKIPDDIVYAVTKGLWSEKARAALDVGHAKGKQIQKESALTGLGLPLHAGAERFYKEAGLLK